MNPLAHLLLWSSNLTLLGLTCNFATFSYAADNVTHTPSYNGTAIGSNWKLAGLSLRTEQNFYIRARGCYFVAAIESSGESINESVRTGFLTGATPTPTPTPPSAPVATAATDVGLCKFTANWTAVVGATGYRLDVFTGYSYCDQLDVDVGNVTSHPVGEEPLCGGFQYLVRAYNAGGTSPDSNTIFVGNVCPDMTPTSTPSPTPVAVSLNISTRAKVQTAEKVMIAGFIITGYAEKTVIVRAIGPSLETQGVNGALGDPVLELHGPDGSVIASDDNWKDDPDQAALIQASGIPPQNDLESAIVATLPPAGYTAVVSGKNGTSGVALVEVYDLNPGTALQLANISTRSFVQTGDNVAIGGFILGGGDRAPNVIIRAIGPSLSNLGVSSPLADPVLELHDGDGTLIAFDDNWQDNPAQAVQIITAGIAPRNELESALAMILAPGAYTAIVSGRNGGTGVGLLEVYNLQ